MVNCVGEDVHHLLQQGFLFTVTVSKSRSVNNLIIQKVQLIPGQKCGQLFIMSILCSLLPCIRLRMDQESEMSYYRKFWSCSKPLANSIRSSLGARVHVGTNLEVAVPIFSPWVTAKESIGQRGFASAGASNYHNPGIRKYWSRRSRRCQRRR